MLNITTTRLAGKHGWSRPILRPSTGPHMLRRGIPGNRRRVPKCSRIVPDLSSLFPPRFQSPRVGLDLKGTPCQGKKLL